MTPFIGRHDDLDSVLELFKDPTVRLVTVIGVGGVGKTRFALEVAGKLKNQFQDGAVLIPMVHLRTGDELLPALAEKLGVNLPPGSDLQQAVLTYLSDRNILLVFDNFEHLLNEAVLLREILNHCLRVKVIVTSREKLNLECENLYRLQGLILPSTDNLSDLEDFDAVRLFIQKAKQVRPGFSINVENAPAILKICQLVGGLPLGILLAAAWAEYFSPAEIADQINKSLDFLTHEVRDGSPRHFSMRAVFDSTLKQLDEHQSAVFRKLTVFRGGFNLLAAEAVVGVDLLTLISLVDKSLLWRNPDSGRYDMHELLRQFAHKELDISGEEADTLASHARYFSEFVYEREKMIKSYSQGVALADIQADFKNINQALSWVIEKRDISTAHKMIPCIYAFCDMRSRFYEGESIFRQAMEGLAPLQGEDPSTAWALALLSWYDMRVYIEPFENFDAILSKAQRCLETATKSHDEEGIAVSQVLLGAITEDQEDFKTAIRYYKKAIQSFPRLDDIYWVNMRIGLSCKEDQRFPEAIQAFQVSLARGRETGERVKIGWSLLNIGDTLIIQGKLFEAQYYLEQARDQFLEVGTITGILWSNYSLSRIAFEENNHTNARELAEKAQQIAYQIHSNSWIKKTNDLLKNISTQHSPELIKNNLEAETFSNREIEVLNLLKSELNGPEIADRLFISLNTVRYHTKNIYRKLQANNRLEAIRRAKELGL